MAKVKVRIAVAVDPKGNWNSCGWGFFGSASSEAALMTEAFDDLEDGAARYWLEAELDVPQETVVQAVVTKDGEP